ncbi:hypothetical protein SERLADRAFT_443792 [Serpula lacrymans var. lacrymans S7.9]|uniref:Uncharacterized protein n=1 Tax=Serpula lacrymans var. lacrymans (strain S7.9) TaxID=578457 RepID=F8PDK2_SERL9|nr:uncharacterized protein SERLADRAFT_443792 [Serpula lacrymans var. lacrymans S7.9]EGO18823.1 hypothetical protein SERLADRAFT_443792 [Serpula lacrymans var. lacrymans S7.9]
MSVQQDSKNVEEDPAHQTQKKNKTTASDEKIISPSTLHSDSHTTNCDSDSEDPPHVPIQVQHTVYLKSKFHSSPILKIQAILD